MSKGKTRTITILMGSLVALAIIFSQLFCFRQALPLKKKVESERQQDENSAGQVYFSVPSTSPPSSFHVELNPNVFFLFEILGDEKVFEIPLFNVSIPSGQFFRTMFGWTISPNAP